jgi:hypothetical protein
MGTEIAGPTRQVGTDLTPAVTRPDDGRPGVSRTTEHRLVDRIGQTPMARFTQTSPTSMPTFW